LIHHPTPSQHFPYTTLFRSCAPALRCHTERGGAGPDDHRRDRHGPRPVGNPGPAMTRRVLVLTHPGRPAAAHTAELVATELRRHSMTPIGEEEIDGGEIELAIVLGGDGTILRGAELVRGRSTPLV